jgi:RHS repeat-associated protein
MNQHFTHTKFPSSVSFADNHTFSAKERDSETGLSYFGARYYSSDLSIWLSVDPQAAKYPHQSNYVYCSNNPLKVIDPNGEDEWEIDNSAARLLQVFIHTLTNPIIISQKRIHCMEIEDI